MIADDTLTNVLIEDLTADTEAISHLNVQPMTSAEISSYECSAPGTSSNVFVDEMSVEMLEDSYYISVDAEEKSVGGEVSSAEIHTATTYWGCKQCDFKCVLFVVCIQFDLI